MMNLREQTMWGVEECYKLALMIMKGTEETEKTLAPIREVQNVIDIMMDTQSCIEDYLDDDAYELADEAIDNTQHSIINTIPVEMYTADIHDQIIIILDILYGIKNELQKGC